MKPVAKMTKAERAAVLRDPNAKLSDLLEIAALDALELQRSKRLRLNMHVFVAPPQSPENKSSKCAVCLAGASLYRELGVRNYSAWRDRDHCGVTENAAINASRINSARVGYTNHGESATIIRRSYNRKTGRAPFRVYIKAAQELRKAGL